MTPIKITEAALGTQIIPEYSTVRCASKGSKWVLLQHPGGFFGLYTGDGAFVRLLPAAVNTSSRPRWSRTDPDVLTFLMGNALWHFNAAKGVADFVLHQFDKYAALDDMGEADLSIDDNHRVLCGLRPDSIRVVFVYELSTGKQLFPWIQTEDFDGLKITRDNFPIVSRASNGEWVNDGDKVRQLTTADGHACIDNVDDSLLWTNSNENPVTLPDFQNAVVKIRIADGKQAGLISFPWSDAMDITMPESGPYCYVSTYGAAERSGKLYCVKMDGSSNEVLLDGINHAVHLYEGQPKFCVSAEGDRGWYAATEADGVTVNTWMVMLAETTLQPGPHVESSQDSAIVIPSGLRPVKFPPNKDYWIHIQTDGQGNPTVTEFEN